MRSRIRSHRAPRSTCRSRRMAGTSLMGSVTTTSHPQPSRYWSMRSRLLRKSCVQPASCWAMDGPSPLLCTGKGILFPIFCLAGMSGRQLFVLFVLPEHLLAG